MLCMGNIQCVVYIQNFNEANKKLIVLEMLAELLNVFVSRITTRLSMSWLNQNLL